MTCSKYNAGMLRTPVGFEREFLESDGAGGSTGTWSMIAGAPALAAAKALSGGERYASERTEAVSKWRIVTRYFEGLLEADRVMMDDKIFNIRFINNVELRNIWLEIDLDGGAAT